SDSRGPVARLQQADELGGLRCLLPLGAHHPPRRRPAWRRLRRRPLRKQEKRNQQETQGAGSMSHFIPQRTGLHVDRRGLIEPAASPLISLAAKPSNVTLGP